MASNKHIGLRNKYCPEDILTDKRKRANFRKSCKNFKIVDGHVTYQGKRRVIFDNDRKLLIPQRHSILPYIILAFLRFVYIYIYGYIEKHVLHNLREVFKML